MPDVRLISLQRINGLDQLDRLPAGMTVETFGDDFAPQDAFVDIAAMMMSLDLVVTTDTATAHLAGALARPHLGRAEMRAGLALAARSRRQPLVSTDAPVPSA